MKNARVFWSMIESADTRWLCCFVDGDTHRDHYYVDTVTGEVFFGGQRGYCGRKVEDEDKVFEVLNTVAATGITE